MSARAAPWAVFVGFATLIGPIRRVHGRDAAPPASEPRNRLQQLYDRGEARFHADDLDGAIAAFAAGLEALGPEDPAVLRAYFSVSLAIAYLDRYDRGGLAGDRQRAQELLEQTVERGSVALAEDPRLEALARRNLARARAHRPEHAPDMPATGQPSNLPQSESTPPSATPNHTAATTHRPAATPSLSAATPSPPAATPSRRAVLPGRGQGLAIGLLVSGTALVAGGIAVVVDGATLERRARAIAEDPPTARQQRYIDQEVPRLAGLRYAIAGPVLAAGAGLLIGGAVVVHRASPRRKVVVRPAVHPRHLGVTVSGSF